MASRAGQVRSHVRVPLYRNAYALMLSGVGSAALGTLFWAIASRAYPPHVVGMSTAAVAALMFVTGVAGLYLDGALYRFLPRAGDATVRLLSWAFLLSVLAAAAASSIFLLGVDVWTPALSFTASSPWIALACIGTTIASCLLVLQDGALIGLRQADWVPAKNISYSIAKIVALVAIAGIAPTYGILVAWALPSVVVLVPVAYLLARYLVPQHREATRPRQERVDARTIAAYAAGNYAGFLCMLAYRNIPPLLVIHQAGARASAFFYVPWLIASSLSLLTTNLSTSLVVEGAFERDHLALHTRRAARQTARLLLPIAFVLFLGAPYVLRIFGGEYADEGAGLLRLLSISLLPVSICVLSFGVARVQDHVRAIIMGQVLLATLVLGLSALLISPLGIEGVGVGWLIAQTTVAVVLFLTQLRPALRAAPAPA